MRYYSPVPGFTRRNHNPVVIDGYEVPSGCGITIQTFLIHHNKEIWPDHDVSYIHYDRFISVQVFIIHRENSSKEAEQLSPIPEDAFYIIHIMLYSKPSKKNKVKAKTQNGKIPTQSMLYEKHQRRTRPLEAGTLV